MTRSLGILALSLWFLGATSSPISGALPGVLPTLYNASSFATTSWAGSDSGDSGILIFTRQTMDPLCPNGIREVRSADGGMTIDSPTQWRYGGCISLRSNLTTGDKIGLTAASSYTFSSEGVETRLFYLTDGRLQYAFKTNTTSWGLGTLDLTVASPGVRISASSIRQTSSGSVHWSVYYTSGSKLYESSQVVTKDSQGSSNWQQNEIGDIGMLCDSGCDVDITSSAWEAVKSVERGLGAYLMSYKRVYLLDRKSGQTSEWRWDSQAQAWSRPQSELAGLFQNKTGSIAISRLGGTGVDASAVAYYSPSDSVAEIRQALEIGGSWHSEANSTAIVSDAGSKTPIEIEVQDNSESQAVTYVHVFYMNKLDQLSYASFALGQSWKKIGPVLT